MCNRTFVLGAQRVTFHLSWVLVTLLLGSNFWGHNLLRPLALHGSVYLSLFALVAYIICIARYVAFRYLYAPEAQGRQGEPLSYVLQTLLAVFALLPYMVWHGGLGLLLCCTVMLVAAMLGVAWGCALRQRYKPSWDQAHKAYWLTNVDALIRLLEGDSIQRWALHQRAKGMNGDQLQRFYARLDRAHRDGLL